MFRWKLFQYQSSRGRLAIDDWRNNLPIGLPRADLDSFLKTMAKKEMWEYPDIRTLSGKKYRGLIELRWRSGNVPHRIIGYSPGSHQFVMLIGCTHNKKKYYPPDCLDTAVRRKKKIESMEASICEFKLITDQGNER